MGRKLNTYYSEDNKGKAEVHFDYKNERAYIKYFDINIIESNYEKETTHFKIPQKLKEAI